MTTTTDYTGYTIRMTIGTGNLGDAEDYASEYAAACESAVSDAYPGAVVTVDVVRASGATAATRVHTPDSDDAGADEIAEQVGRITERVWDRGEFVPDAGV